MNRQPALPFVAQTAPRKAMKTCPRLLTLSAAAVATLLLAACANLAPDYQRPAAPVPAQLPATVAQGSTAAGAPGNAAAEAPLPRWEALILDPQAQALVRLALAHNRDLRIASLNLDRARAQLQISEADRWPTVNAVLSGSRAPNSAGNQVNSFTAGLQLSSYEVDLWGRVRNATSAAQASLLASDASRRSTELGVVAGVAAAWLSLAADEELLALAQRTLRSREETLRLTALRVKLGASADPERLAAESLTAQARASLAQLQRQRQADSSALAVLIGQPLPEALRPATLAVPADTNASTTVNASTSVATRTEPSSALQGDTALAALRPGTSSVLLLNRPDLIAAEQQLIGANANIGAARAALFPRIGLTGSAGAVSSDLGRLITNPTWAYTLAAQAAAAIFDGGRNRANIQVSEISRDIALAQYEKAIQTAFKEAADAIVGLESWQQQLSALQDQLASERDRARLTTLRYQQGATSALDQLDSQRSLFTIEQAVIQTRLAALQNRLALYKALGGWQAPAP